MFVEEGESVRTPVPSMLGVERGSIDQIVADARQAYELGVPGVAQVSIWGQRKRQPRWLMVWLVSPDRRT